MSSSENRDNSENLIHTGGLGEGGQETRLRHTGQEESEAVHHLWGRLAILLQRGNAAILGNRVPNFPLPQVDGLH